MEIPAFKPIFEQVRAKGLHLLQWDDQKQDFAVSQEVIDELAKNILSSEFYSEPWIDGGESVLPQKVLRELSKPNPKRRRHAVDVAFRAEHKVLAMGVEAFVQERLNAASSKRKGSAESEVSVDPDLVELDRQEVGKKVDPEPYLLERRNRLMASTNLPPEIVTILREEDPRRWEIAIFAWKLWAKARSDHREEIASLQASYEAQIADLQQQIDSLESLNAKLASKRLSSVRIKRSLIRFKIRIRRAIAAALEEVDETYVSTSEG